MDIVTKMKNCHDIGPYFGNMICKDKSYFLYPDVKKYIMLNEIMVGKSQ